MLFTVGTTKSMIANCREQLYILVFGHEALNPRRIPNQVLFSFELHSFAKLSLVYLTSEWLSRCECIHWYALQGTRKDPSIMSLGVFPQVMSTTTHLQSNHECLRLCFGCSSSHRESGVGEHPVPTGDHENGRQDGIDIYLPSIPYLSKE